MGEVKGPPHVLTALSLTPRGRESRACDSRVAGLAAVMYREGMTDHSANLAAAIADLKRRRAEIDTAISSMETILQNIYGLSAAPSRSSERTRSSNDTSASQATTARSSEGIPGDDSRIGDWTEPRSDRVRRLFEENPETVFTSEMLATRIGEEPDEATLKAIYGILSRLNHRDGLVERVGRGAYRSANASAPAATGAEESGESTGDSPLEEGGPDNGSATPDGRDGNAYTAHDHHGHGGRRAAIGGTVTS